MDPDVPGVIGYHTWAFDKSQRGVVYGGTEYRYRDRYTFLHCGNNGYVDTHLPGRPNLTVYKAMNGYPARTVLGHEIIRVD